MAIKTRAQLLREIAQVSAKVGKAAEADWFGTTERDAVVNLFKDIAERLVVDAEREGIRLVEAGNETESIAEV